MTKENFQSLFLEKINKIHIDLTLIQQGFTEEDNYVYSSKLKIPHRFYTDYSYNLEVEYMSENDFDYPCCCLFTFSRQSAVLVHVRVQIFTVDEVTLFLDYIIKACEVHYEYDVVLQQMDEMRRLPASFMREKIVDEILKDLEDEI